MQELHNNGKGKLRTNIGCKLMKRPSSCIGAKYVSIGVGIWWVWDKKDMCKIHLPMKPVIPMRSRKEASSICTLSYALTLGALVIDGSGGADDDADANEEIFSS